MTNLSSVLAVLGLCVFQIMNFNFTVDLLSMLNEMKLKLKLRKKKNLSFVIKLIFLIFLFVR